MTPSAESDEKNTRNLTNYVTQSQMLTTDTYTEEDGLLFSDLSYAKFERCQRDSKTLLESMDQNGDGRVPVQQFARNLLKVEPKGERRALLSALVDSPRYKNCYITNLSAVSDGSQFAAMTIDIGAGTSVIAMRGTDGTTVGWTEDFQLSYDLDGTKAQQHAADYLRNERGSHLYLAGHSKGGNDVISAYLMNDSSVRERVERIDNYDGSGVNRELKGIYRKAYNELEEKLHNYYPKHSIVGQLLEDPPGSSTYVAANIENSDHKKSGVFAEHDPYAWVFADEDNRLQKTKQSVLSRGLNRIIDQELRGMPVSERFVLVQLLCRLGVPEQIAKREERDSLQLDWKYLIPLVFAAGYFRETERIPILRSLRRGLTLIKASGISSANRRIEARIAKEEAGAQTMAGGSSREFSVDTAQLAAAQTGFARLSKQLAAEREELRQLAGHLQLDSPSGRRLARQLTAMSGRLEQLEKTAARLGGGLLTITEIYQQTERRIV